MVNISGCPYGLSMLDYIEIKQKKFTFSLKTNKTGGVLLFVILHIFDIHPVREESICYRGDTSILYQIAVVGLLHKSKLSAAVQ